MKVDYVLRRELDHVTIHITIEKKCCVDVQKAGRECGSHTGDASHHTHSTGTSILSPGRTIKCLTSESTISRALTI